MSFILQGTFALLKVLLIIIAALNLLMLQ